MTPFAAQVLSGLPDPTSARAANNYEILQQFRNHNDKYSAQVRRPGDPAHPLLRPRAATATWTSSTSRRSRCPRAAAATASPTCRTCSSPPASTWAPADDQLLEFRFGCSRTKAGKNPPALGTPGAEEDYGITGLPTDPRVAGGLPAQLIPGFSDLGRQATNPQWQYPTVFNPKINYTRTLGRHSVKTGHRVPARRAPRCRT